MIACDPASGADEVRLEGVKLALPRQPAAPVYSLYYKPVGKVTTRSGPERHPTVFERPAPARPDGGSPWDGWM